MSQAHHTEDDNCVDRPLVERLQEVEALAEDIAETLQIIEASPSQEDQETAKKFRGLIEETRKVTGEMQADLEQQQKVSDLLKSLWNRRRSVILGPAQEISDDYREEMLSHAAGLEKFGSDENPETQKRPANYHIIHEGNIKKDEEALCFLAQHEPRMLKHACEGFEVLYGISITEYDNFQIATAPDEVVNAFNKKSDMNHFHFSMTRSNPQLKNWAVSICDSIIDQWKSHISSSGKEVLRIENIRGQIGCVEKSVNNMFQTNA